MTKHPQPTKSTPVNEMTIGSVTNSCAVLFGGRNVVCGLRARSKLNRGFGRIGSNSRMVHNAIALDDQDCVDAPIRSQMSRSTDTVSRQTGSRES